MNWKSINIIFIIIILIEFVIIKVNSNQYIEISIPTVNRVEEKSLNDIINGLNNCYDLKILNIINNKEYYSIQVEIRGDNKEFTNKLEGIKEYDIVGYELKMENKQLIGIIMLKYKLNI